MSKKAIFFSEAEKLYVVELMTLEQISERLPITTRTLQDWKKFGNWEEKRSTLAKANDDAASDFLTFRSLFMARARAKLEAGEDLNASELQTAAKLGADLFKTAYQSDLANTIEDAKEAAPEDKEAMTKSAMEAVAKYLKEGGL
jgi:hypothetical protein